MPSCRATSFYVAPGKKYDFATARLCARERSTDGSAVFVEFTHRKDLERYEQAHPDWDRVCYVAPRANADSLSQTLVEHPELVERWQLDTRVVNGRAPAGPAHVLHNLSSGGLKKAGGLPNVLALFAGANKPLRDAVTEAAGRGDGLSLSLALALRSRVGDEPTAKIALSNRFSTNFAVAPVDVVLAQDAFDRLSARYGKSRALTLFTDLTSALPERWQGVVARNAHTTPETLAWLAQSDFANVRSAVAANPNTPPESLTVLSGDLNRGVVNKVAQNPAIPAELLDLFLNDEDPRSLANVAPNPALPAETLTMLSCNEDPVVRGGVAKNPAAPPDMLAKLAEDPDRYVRASVARNENTPPRILNALALEVHKEPRDGRDKVANAAWLNPNTPLETIRTAITNFTGIRNVSFEQIEAHRPETSPERLAELANSPKMLARFYVALHASTPVETLLKLTHDEDPTVRRYTGHNANLPLAERVRVLSESPDPDAVIVLSRLLRANPGLGQVPHPAWVHIEEALANEEAESITSRPRVMWPPRPRSIYELPGRDAADWSMDDSIAELSGKAFGGGLTAKVLATKHELITNANYMGNCTAGYAKRIASGRSVVLALVDGDGVTQYNAAFEKSPLGTITVGEVNSRFNRGQVPDDVRATLSLWAEELAKRAGSSRVLVSA